MYHFVKIENFSFFIDKILQTCRPIFLMLENYSAESGEHSWYLQCVSEVCREQVQSLFPKWYFFQKAFFHMCLGGFNLWKKLFGKNIIFKKGSELGSYTLLTHIVGIRNVLQSQGNGSLPSEWSFDMFGGFYRWKTKIFRILQNDTPMKAFVKCQKGPFSHCLRKRNREISGSSGAMAK